MAENYKGVYFLSTQTGIGKLSMSKPKNGLRKCGTLEYYSW